MSLEILKQIIFEYFETDNFLKINVSKQGNAEVYIIKIENTNYIIRITSNPYSIFNSVYALKKLEKTNVGPKIITSGNIGNYNYSIETFLFGEIRSKLNLNQIKLLMEKIVRVHLIKNKKCGYLTNLQNDWNLFVKNDMILKYKEKFEKICPNSNKYINYALNNIPQTNNFYMLHGDLTNENILFTDNEAFLFDFEGCFYGEKEYDIAYLNFRLEFSGEELDLIIKLTKYDKQKILYYSLCILIRKIALSPKKDLNRRINLIKKIYDMLNN